MRWSLADGCGFAFGTVAVVPPLEMAPPLEMLRNRVGSSAALSCCIAAVDVILMVDFLGPISEVDCRCRPR